MLWIRNDSCRVTLAVLVFASNSVTISGILLGIIHLDFKMTACCRVLYFLLLIGLGSPSKDENHTLHLAGLFPMRNAITNSTGEGPGILPAVLLGLEHVNKNPSILPDYMLEIDFNDTEVRQQREPWAICPYPPSLREPCIKSADWYSYPQQSNCCPLQSQF